MREPHKKGVAHHFFLRLNGLLFWSPKELDNACTACNRDTSLAD